MAATTRAASWQGSLRSAAEGAAAAQQPAAQQQQQQQQSVLPAAANGLMSMLPTVGLGGSKRAVVAKGAPAARAALGDISNKASGAGLGFRVSKKAGAGASKPFAVAGQFEEEKSELGAASEAAQLAAVQHQHQHQHQPDFAAAMMVDEEHSSVAGSLSGSGELDELAEHGVDAADLNDLHNPKYAAEYVSDIYRHYRAVEGKYMPAADYMERQTDINAKMRALLVDWLVQVHVKFELLPQTLYLTVNVLDRFLERKVVARRKLQLVGCAAMLVASKYEEIYAPECADFVSMSDKAFTADELLKMESALLNELGFHLTTPSPYTFLRRYMKVTSSSAKTQHFATYLIERSLQEFEMLEYRPSLLAAAALHIAQGLTDGRAWGSTLARHSGYEERDLDACVDHIKRSYSCNQKNYLQAVTKKYASSKYMHVSMINLV